MAETTAEQACITIKKYPNRRYYNSAQSCHVTLEEIHRLICGGQQVCVVDSKSGDDITSRVLAQIILEMDSLKLSLFPSPLLHKLIQSNETIVQEFVDVYFSKALDWFLTSRQVFEEQFRRAVGLDAQAQAGVPGGGFLHPMLAAMQPMVQPAPPPATMGDAAVPAELHDRLEQLTRRVEVLQGQLHTARAAKA